MGFFESPPPRERPPQPREPEWFGPPHNELGVGVPGRYLLVRTDEVAIAVQNVVAFSSGFSFVLSARLRPGVQVPDRGGLLAAIHPYGNDSDPLLRFGVQFADGRKATNLGRDLVAEGGDPGRPVLLARGGQGGETYFDQGQWVWPLPPPGPLAFVCEWPARGLALIRCEVPAQPILDAAAQSQPLWHERGDDEGGAWTSSIVGA